MMNYYMYVVGGALGVVLEPHFYKFLDPALYIPTSLPQQAAKTDMLSVVSVQVLCTVEEGVANACND